MGFSIENNPFVIDAAMCEGLRSMLPGIEFHKTFQLDQPDRTVSILRGYVYDEHRDIFVAEDNQGLPEGARDVKFYKVGQQVGVPYLSLGEKRLDRHSHRSLAIGALSVESFPAE